MSKEQLIYPAQVWQYTSRTEGSMVPYSLYAEARQSKRVGDSITHFAGAPGIGSVTYRITRMDDSGVYGVVTRNTMRELTAADVI